NPGGKKQRCAAPTSGHDFPLRLTDRSSHGASGLASATKHRHCSSQETTSLRAGSRIGRSGRAAVRLVAGQVAIITALAPLLAPAADAEPRARTTGQPVLDGGRVESHSVYTLDPAARAVHVRVDVTVTNQMPNVRQGNSILESYLSGFNEPVPAETAN